MKVGIVDGSMVLDLGNWIIVSFIKIWVIGRRGTALEGSNVYIFFQVKRNFWVIHVKIFAGIYGFRIQLCNDPGCIEIFFTLGEIALVQM